MDIKSLRRDLMIATKSKNKIAKSCLQVLLADVLNERIEKHRELTEEEILSLIRKNIKQLNQTISMAKDRDTTEYLNKVEFYKNYLPKELTNDEIVDIISKNCFGETNKGVIMKKLIPIVKGRVDNKKLSMYVDTYLGLTK